MNIITLVQTNGELIIVRDKNEMKLSTTVQMLQEALYHVINYSDSDKEENTNDYSSTKS